MEKIVLFGTCLASKLIHFSLSLDPGYEVTAFTADRKYISENTFCGLPVIPFEDVEKEYPPSEYKMFIGLYASDMNKLRAVKYAQAKEKGYTLISYIHPQSIIAPDLVIGDNCFISEGVICRPGVTVGNNVIIMAGALITHHVIIQDHALIGVRAVVMGRVVIESYSMIGPNATIMEDVTIGAECLIGAGAVIQQSTKEKEVYKAAPAARLPLTSDKLAKIVFRNRL